MEEKIPQLTLTPDLEKEPVLETPKEEDLIEKSEKAPEAGPDLSMLSQAEQQARPVTRPTWSLCCISSGKKRRGPRNFSRFAPVIISRFGAFSSTKRIAHLRHTAASSRSSVRTPDSLV